MNRMRSDHESVRDSPPVDSVGGCPKSCGHHIGGCGSAGWSASHWPRVSSCRLAGRLSDLPDGYGGKQDDSVRVASLSEDQPEKQLKEWSTLRAATARDIFVYVPIYLVWGLALAAIVAAAKSKKESSAGQWWVRIVKAPRTIAIAVIVTAVTDLIETALFRTSLTRLVDGGGAASIELLTRVTAPLTRLKYVAGAAAFVLLVIQVLASPVPAQRADNR